jgi:hypothetical protein
MGSSDSGTGVQLHIEDILIAVRRMDLTKLGKKLTKDIEQ